MAMAEKSRGLIQLKFEEFGWKEILERAWQEAKDWAEALDTRKAKRHVVLKVNDAIGNMTAIGDKNILHSVLGNLLKNAIKYSLPRMRDQPMIIEVFGQPQRGWHIVQVMNWGIGIDANKKEAIFRRFYRIERADRIRAIGGI